MANSALINKRMDYTFSQYYFNCDSINKYNLISFEKIPVIKQLSLEFSLGDVLNSFITKSSNVNENHMQIISFLFMYIISNIFPYIHFNTIKITNKNAFCLKVIFTKEQNIYNFLHDLQYSLRIERIKEFDAVNYKNKMTYDFSTVYKAENFYELENIISKYFKNINIKELDFFLHFKIANFINLKSSKSFIKNFTFLDN